MKARIVTLLAMTALLLSVAAAPAAARTPTVTADRAGADLVLVPESDTVTEDLYAAGRRVVVEGTVQGDILAGATGEVRITGHVMGNVTVAASSLVITGQVDGSVRVAASTVQVDGVVGGDLLAGASTVTVTGEVGRDLLAWTLNLDASGTVGRDIGGQTFGQALIGGTVGGDVDITGGRIEVLSGTKIEGTLGYRSTTEAVIGQNVEVGRQIVRRQPVRPNVRVEAVLALTEIVTVLTILILGFLMFWAAPALLERSVFALRRFPVRTFFIGLAALFVPVVIIGYAARLAFASSPELALPTIVIGGPIALTVVGLIALGLLLAPIPVLTTVGGRLLGWRRSGQAGFLVGALLWVISLLIPFVGAVVVVIVGVLGLGAWTIGMVSGRTQPDGSARAPEQPGPSPTEWRRADEYPLPPEQPPLQFDDGPEV